MLRRMIFIKGIMIACALLAAWMPTSGQEVDGGKICAYATWGDKACGMDEEMACPMLSVMKFPQALYVANCLKRSGQALDTEITVRKRKLMAGCRTGMARIPSAVGADDVVVHKTGTGFPTAKGISAINDAGIIIHPDGTHTIMAIFALDIPDAPTAEKALRQKVMEMEAMRHEE